PLHGDGATQLGVHARVDDAHAARPEPSALEPEPPDVAPSRGPGPRPPADRGEDAVGLPEAGRRGLARGAAVLPQSLRAVAAGVAGGLRGARRAAFDVLHDLPLVLAGQDAGDEPVEEGGWRTSRPAVRAAVRGAHGGSPRCSPIRPSPASQISN